jgi:cobyrinic acid a,c-diamide synthase
LESVLKTIVIAGTSSGAGKTTISLGLMAAFREQGRIVQPFKVGPDFIDPLFHKKVCGRASRNLDGWLMDEETILSSFHRASKGADLCVVEGVMGLFDGYDPRSETGSTAEIAKWLGAPVILVVDARSMIRSAGALIRGFETFDPDLNVAGVIFNRVGSERHLQWLGETVKEYCQAECLGGIFRDSDLSIPERHLGLSTERTDRIDPSWKRGLVRKISEGVDLEAVSELAKIKENVTYHTDHPFTGDKVRIGVAMDEAFCFYYEDNLDLLREMGAELVPFSPLHDSHLPGGLNGLYLGGGYPEVHAQTLSENRSMLAEVREAAESGLPVYAECGGMMFLSKGVYDPGGVFHSMAGVFPFATEMLRKRQALGYVTVTVVEENLLGKPGDLIRGHEFHYSRVVELDGDVKFSTLVQKRAGEEKRPEGFKIRNTFGSYVHLHFGSNPEPARNLVTRMREGAARPNLFDRGLKSAGSIKNHG